MTTLLLALLLGPINPAHAANYTVKQILSSRNRVVVDGAGDLQPGAELIATFKNGSQCTLKVTAVEGKIANADTSYCENAAALVVGQSLEKSLFVEEDRPVRTKPSSGASASAPTATKSTWVPRNAPARKITDLQYFPGMGEFVFSPALGFAQFTRNTKVTATKDDYTKITTEMNVLQADFLYGHTQDFTYGVQVGYLINETSTISYGDGSASAGQKDTVKADGFRDPVFQGGYRWFEQDTMPVIVDLFARWSPAVGKAKSGNTKARGTGFRGGNLFGLSGEVGSKSPGFSFVFGLDLDFYGAANKADATSGVGKRNSPLNVYTLRAGGQMPITQTLHVRGQLARITSSENVESSPGQDVGVDANPQTEISAALVQEWSDRGAVKLMAAKRLEQEASGSVGGTQFFDVTSEQWSITLSGIFVF